jgi:hypothetical protein
MGQGGNCVNQNVGGQQQQHETNARIISKGAIIATALFYRCASSVDGRGSRLWWREKDFTWQLSSINQYNLFEMNAITISLFILFMNDYLS